METRQQIEQLKLHFGTYKKSAEYIQVSKERYYQWVADADSIPRQGKRLIELAVESIRDNPHQLKS